MNLLILIIFSINFNLILSQEIKYIINDVPDNIRHHLLGIFIDDFNAKDNWTTIATKLVLEMNENYGPQWFCIIGQSLVIPTNMDAEPNTKLLFNFNSRVDVLIYKSRHLTQTEIIQQSRKLSANNVTIVKSEMNDDMKRYAIEMILADIKWGNSFGIIASNISANFDKKYGPYWHCFVGTNAIDASVRYISGALISLNIGDTSIILFQTALPDKMMGSSSVISRALSSQPDVYYNTGVTKEVETKIINMTKDAVKSCNDYFQIISYLKTRLTDEFGGKWVITVGTSSDYWVGFLLKDIIGIELMLNEVQFMFYNIK